MSAQPAAPLSQGAGYGVIIGLGAFFAIVCGHLSEEGIYASTISSDDPFLLVFRSSLDYLNLCESMQVVSNLQQSMPLHLDLLVLGLQPVVPSVHGAGECISLT